MIEVIKVIGLGLHFLKILVLEDVEKKDKPWDWWYLSINSNITMDIVKKNMDKIIE